MFNYELPVLHGIVWGACPDWMSSEEGEALADRVIAAVQGNLLLPDVTGQRNELRAHDLASELGRTHTELRMIAEVIESTRNWTDHAERNQHVVSVVQHIAAHALARFDNTGGEQS